MLNYLLCMDGYWVRIEAVGCFLFFGFLCEWVLLLQDVLRANIKRRKTLDLVRTKYYLLRAG